MLQGDHIAVSSNSAAFPCVVSAGFMQCLDSADQAASNQHVSACNSAAFLCVVVSVGVARCLDSAVSSCACVSTKLFWILQFLHYLGLKLLLLLSDICNPVAACTKGSAGYPDVNFGFLEYLIYVTQVAACTKGSAGYLMCLLGF
jgi:hypothetical protein